MSPDQKYSIKTDVLFEPLQRIDLEPIIAATTDPWFNQTLCQVNDAVVRLGVLKGEFHWHKHDTQDEFFYVVDGELVIELEGRSVELGPMQGFTVPMGVQHRPLAPLKTIVLMIERADVSATGDSNSRPPSSLLAGPELRTLLVEVATNAGNQ